MISALTFFQSLNWIDGTPLTIEPYRQDIFRKALDSYKPDGKPTYNFVLAGRGKKNSKSLDLILAGLFILICREDPRGSDALIVANDSDQAGQDLDLAKKLIAANPELADELTVLSEEIRRKDGRGIMRIIPAQNVVGQHGKSAAFVGYDEIHGLRSHELFEALAPDPNRYCLVWVTSYDTIHDEEGVPMHDFKKIGREGADPGMLFSWYSGDYCTDPAFADLAPEERANPSMSSWPEGRDYLARQRRRLPSAQFRRLHLNLPGAPKGVFFDQNIVESAIVAGRSQIEPVDGVDYLAFVDMSGGSSDDATLGIAHWDGTKAILDVIINQNEPVPFNPRKAVARFAATCKRYRCREVHGDSYAGETFRMDFSDHGIDYRVCKNSRTDHYENLEVALNAGQVELLDPPKLRRELLTIVRRGASLDHMPGQHDDWANSAAGALTLVNPDIGAGEPGILTFYARQVEALANGDAKAPEKERLVAAEVMVRVPIETSIVTGAVSGRSYFVERDGDQLVCWMDQEDAWKLTSATNPLFANANIGLHEQISEERKRLGNQSGPGIRVQDLLDYTRPVLAGDKLGITRQTFEMMRRAR
ncbi:hypothetical protein AAFG13_06085 [Bradyrhizobium sp. B124]|uniref:hypothetical protein n=1 Tax=Bradyrhizobium sp. B124 TaxID=3140245 RepID=UPI0031835691